MLKAGLRFNVEMLSTGVKPGNSKETNLEVEPDTAVEVRMAV